MSATCDYCGLPARPPVAGSDELPVFCCLGCQIASEIVSSAGAATDGDSSAIGGTAFRLGLAVFFSMNVMVFTMVLWSWDAYSIASSSTASALKELLRFACLLFATPVLMILGRPLLLAVAHQWRNQHLTTDGLLAAGVVTAFVYSLASLLAGQEHIYFEVACMILVAVTLGKWLEAEGKHRAMKSLQSLQNLLPNAARVVTNDHDTSMQPLDTITLGQTIRVLPGERVPLDGAILRGEGFFDQRLVTGESQPINRTVGDSVFGGSLNLDGSIDVRVDAEPSTGTIPRLIAAVREAAERTGPTERLADRLAASFVPVIVVIVAIVFGYHYTHGGLNAALMSSMAVTLIACPCALAIATPLAVWAALGTAARQGVVFRGSDAIMRLAEIDTICFDKTGTLTLDAPRLVAETVHDNAEMTKSVAVQLAAQTLHPLAGALRDHLSTSSIHAGVTVGTATTVAGRGVAATITIQPSDATDHSTTTRHSATTGHAAVLGSADFCVSEGLKIPDALATAQHEAIANGQSTVFVGWDGSVRACFAFEESLRPQANTVVKQLRQRGMPVLLLSGDQSNRAVQVADRLEVQARTALLPEDKRKVILNLQQQGQRVAMVGDGLNDAPALGVADVGIALGCGVEVTRDAADVCLMSSELSLLPWAIDLANRTKLTIRKNLCWALVYNTIGIGLAASGRLNPIFAAVAMVFSSSFVIIESLRLTTIPPPHRVGDDSSAAASGTAADPSVGDARPAALAELETSIT